MADPLSLLREYVSTGRIEEVVLTGDRVDFGGKFSFNKTVPTGYKSQQGKGNFYDLETLLFFAKHVDAKFTDYFKKAGKEIGKAVTFVDRKDLQEYLTGRSDRSEYIQLTVPDLEVQHAAKRARIDEGGAAAAGPSAAAPEAEEEAAEAAALRRIRESEVQLRDRNSMLSVPGRSFRKVLTLLSQAQREQQQKEHVEKLKAKQRAATHKPALPVRPSGRYERQTQQDATLKQLGAAELGVQVGFKPTGPAADGVPPPPPQQQQGAAPPPPPPQQRPSGRPDAAAQAQRNVSRSEQHRRQVAAHTAQAPQRQHRGTPIVMVPPGMTALLNMHNIRSFLEKGEFQTTEEAKRVKPVKEDRAAIERTIGCKGPVKFYVTDKEPTSRSDWDRVVAVVCSGKAWQFKKWPFKGAAEGNLVDTFSRVLGVFVHYTDEQVDATVKSWNVKILGLNRQSRHRDLTVAQEFWRLLDTHLAARSSSLLYRR